MNTNRKTEPAVEPGVWNDVGENDRVYRTVDYHIHVYRRPKGWIARIHDLQQETFNDLPACKTDSDAKDSAMREIEKLRQKNAASA
jgi:hypothetical protein